MFIYYILNSYNTLTAAAIFRKLAKNDNLIFSQYPSWRHRLFKRSRYFFSNSLPKLDLLI